MESLVDLLRRQFHINNSKNLLHSNARHLLEVDPMFLSAMEELIAAPDAVLDASILNELASSAAALLVERVYAINQYVQVDVYRKAELERIYLASWRRFLQSRDIELTLRNFHYPEIARFLKSVYPPSLAKALRSSPKLGAVPCSGYSGALQMRILRLGLSSLRQPVLDIGCGRNAQLVTHLRAAGMKAYGIDRTLDVRLPFLSEASWFDYSLAPDSWGTVVSHLAFTNHFKFIRIYQSGEIPRYLDRYLEILGSLVEGGSFAYAPGDDFLESHIDRGCFETTTWPVAGGVRATLVTKRIAPGAATTDV